MVDDVKPERSDLALLSLDSLLESGNSIEMSLAEAVKLFPDQSAVLTDAALLRKFEMCDATTDMSISELVSNAIGRTAAARRPKPIAKLVDSVKAVGLKTSDIVSHLKIGTSIFIKLDRRMIEPASIPDELLSSLADQLYEPLDRLLEYLSRPATASSAVTFKADEQPSVKPKETFRAALNASLTADHLDKSSYEYWLSMVQTEVEQEGR